MQYVQRSSGDNQHGRVAADLVGGFVRRRRHSPAPTEQNASLLPQSLRCEACKVWKDVTERMVVRQLAQVLCFGFPRNGSVQDGRMEVDQYRGVCPSSFSQGEDVYELVAIVQHIASEQGKADGGHYIAWVRQETHWQQYNDAIVTDEVNLPEDIWKTVVLATYEVKASASMSPKAASRVPEPQRRDGHEQSSATQENETEGVQDGTAARHSIDGIWPEDLDGPLEAEQAVQKLLHKYRAGEDYVSFLRGLPPIAAEVEAMSVASITQQLPQVVDEADASGGG